MEAPIYTAPSCLPAAWPCTTSQLPSKLHQPVICHTPSLPTHGHGPQCSNQGAHTLCPPPPPLLPTVPSLPPLPHHFPSAPPPLAPALSNRGSLSTRACPFPHTQPAWLLAACSCRPPPLPCSFLLPAPCCDFPPLSCPRLFFSRRRPKTQPPAPCTSRPPQLVPAFKVLKSFPRAQQLLRPVARLLCPCP